MPHIQCLPPYVAELIAAGEVVERPASVVKELVENALDAGATAVVVELRQGGLSYLRVTDNGCGIAPEELPTAFLRHATSKLRSASELSALSSLGFRGEALAAICAVSRVDIFSAVSGGVGGASLHVEGGVAGEVEPAGCPVGTTVCVRDLFYNTPARMKFMKKDSAEAAAITGLVNHLALSRPDVSFKLLRDGQEALHTPGDGLLSSAVSAVLGREFARSLLAVEGRGGAVSVSGFVTSPLSPQGSRARQVFFVNGRFVKVPVLTAALEEAYKNTLMKGRFPGGVLHLTLPPEEVDVNVHPAKTVVKFAAEKAVFDAVYYTVKDALSAEMPAPARREEDDFYRRMSAQEYRAAAGEKKPLGSFTAAPAKAPPEPITPPQPEKKPSRKKNAEPTLEEMLDNYEIRKRMIAEGKTPPYIPQKEPEVPQLEPGDMLYPPPKPRREIYLWLDDVQKPAGGYTDTAVSVEKAVESGANPVENTAKTVENPVGAVENPPAPAEDEQLTLSPTEQPWRIVGEVLKTYIVCQDAEDTVWLIDKHAAHERMRFDALCRNAQPVMSQPLLCSVAVTPSPEGYAAALARRGELEALGFRFEDFGGGTLLLREVAEGLAAEDAAATLEELCQTLALGGTPESVRNGLLQTMACKSAIKAGQINDERELRALVEQVQCGAVKYCPHGRPVKVPLSRYEIEKMFKRA